MSEQHSNVTVTCAKGEKNAKKAATKGQQAADKLAKRTCSDCGHVAQLPYMLKCHSISHKKADIECPYFCGTFFKFPDSVPTHICRKHQ